MTSAQTIVVLCPEDQPAFNLHCEPEGMVHEVRPGDALTITFRDTAPAAPIEVFPVSGGIVLGRGGDGEVDIRDKRGRTLEW